MNWTNKNGGNMTIYRNLVLKKTVRGFLKHQATLIGNI